MLEIKNETSEKINLLNRLKVIVMNQLHDINRKFFWKIFFKEQWKDSLFFFFFTVLQISLMYSLMEDNWILISNSAFNLLQYVVLVEVYEENLASHRSVVTKRGVV